MQRNRKVSDRVCDDSDFLSDVVDFSPRPGDIVEEGKAPVFDGPTMALCDDGRCLVTQYLRFPNNGALLSFTLCKMLAGALYDLLYSAFHRHKVSLTNGTVMFGRHDCTAI